MIERHMARHGATITRANHGAPAAERKGILIFLFIGAGVKQKQRVRESESERNGITELARDRKSVV